MLGWQCQTINKIFTNMLIIAEDFIKILFSHKVIQNTQSSLEVPNC
jgi:hypothetical protein